MNFLYGSIPGSKQHDFSCLMAVLPKDISDQIISWGKEHIPEESICTKECSGREDYIHVTIKYGIHEATPISTKEALKGQSIVKAKLGKVSLFKNEDKSFDVVKLDIHSSDLIKLHKSIGQKVENTENFPEYVPHVTIAFVNKGMADHLVGDTTFEDIEVDLSTLDFSGKDGEIESFSLASSKVEAAYDNHDILLDPRIIKHFSQREVPESDYRDFERTLGVKTQKYSDEDEAAYLDNTIYVHPALLDRAKNHTLTDLDIQVLVHELEHALQDYLLDWDHISTEYGEAQEDNTPYMNIPIELGAYIQEVRLMLSRGKSEEEIINQLQQVTIDENETHPSKEQIQYLIDVAQEIDPQFVISTQNKLLLYTSMLASLATKQPLEKVGVQLCSNPDAVLALIQKQQSIILGQLPIIGKTILMLGGWNRFSTLVRTKIHNLYSQSMLDLVAESLVLYRGTNYTNQDEVGFWEDYIFLSDEPNHPIEYTQSDRTDKVVGALYEVTIPNAKIISPKLLEKITGIGDNSAYSFLHSHPEFINKILDAGFNTLIDPAEGFYVLLRPMQQGIKIRKIWEKGKKVPKGVDNKDNYWNTIASTYTDKEMEEIYSKTRSDSGDHYWDSTGGGNVYYDWNHDSSDYPKPKDMQKADTIEQIVPPSRRYKTWIIPPRSDQTDLFTAPANDGEIEASLQLVSYIRKHKDGWHVFSEKGKHLGGPYSSKEKAVHRLKQVEYFKHKKGAATAATAAIYTNHHQQELINNILKAVDKLGNIVAEQFNISIEEARKLTGSIHFAIDPSLSNDVVASFSPPNIVNINPNKITTYTTDQLTDTLRHELQHYFQWTHTKSIPKTKKQIQKRRYQNRPWERDAIIQEIVLRIARRQADASIRSWLRVAYGFSLEQAETMLQIAKDIEPQSLSGQITASDPIDLQEVKVENTNADLSKMNGRATLLGKTFTWFATLVSREHGIRLYKVNIDTIEHAISSTNLPESTKRTQIDRVKKQVQKTLHSDTSFTERTIPLSKDLDKLLDRISQVWWDDQGQAVLPLDGVQDLLRRSNFESNYFTTFSTGSTNKYSWVRSDDKLIVTKL